MQNIIDVNREGEERLHPSLTNPNWLVLRERRKIFRKWLNGVAGEHLSVLDVGGRIQPYRPLLSGRIARYWAMDFREGPHVNVLARGESIPFRAGQFDLVICTQVLEYVTEPQTLISELHRVLKPGGYLLLSAPAIFPRDSDHDLWRFMPHSLRFLLRGFENVQVVPEGSSLIGFFRTVAVYTVMFVRPALLRKFSEVTLVPALNIAGAVIESIVSTKNDQFSPNFSALARK
jgi:SAM-dependent methyltransferase